MKLDVILMLVIPLENFVKITLVPAKCPPVANHFDSILLRHFKNRLGFVRIVVNQNPMLPMMRVIVDMMQPRVIEILHNAKRTILTVEVIVVSLILTRFILTSVMILLN